MLLGSASASLLGQEILLDRYYVNAPPLASDATGVTSNAVRSHLPVDVGALVAREVAAVSPVRRGGVASDVLLRGLGRDNVTVALDGAPAHAACPGRMDPPVFHVSSPLIEHIAIGAGPFDVRRGGAPGGVIAVESAAPPAERFATLGLLGGSADLRNVDAAVGGPVGGGWRLLAAGSYQEGLSYRDGTGHRISETPGLNYRPEWRDATAFAIGHAEVHARWADATGHELGLRAAINDGVDVLYPALMMDAQRDRATRLGATWAAPVQLPWADHWRLQLYHHRVEHDMSDAFRQSSLGMFAARGWMMRTIAATTNYGAQLETDVRRGDTTLTTGAQAGARHWVADNVIGASANAMIPDVTIRNVAAYTQAERATGPWRLRAGLRAEAWRSAASRDVSFAQRAHGTDRNRQTDAALMGHVFGERVLTPAVTLFGGVGHGARVPDPQERYTVVNRPGTGTDWVGNPTLDPVRGTELTAGARGTAGRVSWNARAFHLRFDDYIVLGRLTPAPGSTANPARTESYFGIGAELTGAEAKIQVGLAPGWTAAFDAAGQRGRKRSLAPNDTDRDLPDIPPWRGRAALRWESAGTWAQFETQWSARQNRVDTDAGERPLGGHAALNLRAEHALGHGLTLSAGVENLLDRAYAVHNAYTRDPFAAGLLISEPGRYLYAQLRWRL